MNDFSSGTQFDFTYAPGTSAEQILAFEMAGEVWSSRLNDDVAVNIYVESTSELPDEVIGAALPGKKKKEEFKKVKRALGEDITSADDTLAFTNLPSDDKEFSILINGQELEKTKDLRLTNANAKSLGLLRNDSDKLDGYILVNDLASNPSVGWDYDALRSTGIQGNSIDLLSVAMHEIGHVLGFVSGIDDSEWLNVLTELQDDDDDELEDKDFKFASPLDLYRYSDSRSEPGDIDLSIGGNPYFSIDGGNSNRGSFANGEYTQFGGDGYQASHWKQYSSQGIMNPVLPNGQRRDISNLDLTAMDVIGWDINTAAAPSWSEMYANAEKSAGTANIQNREKDVEKLIRESGYDIIRRSRYARGRRYSAQLGGFWQFTTTNAVNNSEAIDLAVEDSTIVAAEVEDLDPAEPVETNNIDPTNLSNPDNLSADNQSVVVSEPETVVNTENVERVQVDPIPVENSSNTIPTDVTIEPAVSVNDVSQADRPANQSEAEVIIANGNSTTLDSQTPFNNEAIATNKIEIQPEPEIAGYDLEGVPTETVEIENIQPVNVVEPIVEQALNTTATNPTTVAGNDLGDSLDDSTESVKIASYNSELYDDDDGDDDKVESYGYLSTPDYLNQEPLDITGVLNNDPNNLF